MRNNSPDSESSQIISISDASECTNSITQFPKKTVTCCPTCGSYLIIYRPTLNAYTCNGCHTHFETPVQRQAYYTPTNKRAKIQCKNKYQLCEECHKTFVPTTEPTINGQRICSNCAPRHDIGNRAQTIQTKYTQIHAAQGAF